jgi:hypothetical protein
MYYDQIQKIWELDFHGFKIPLFHCNWVDAIKGVVPDKYGFISVDLNHQEYKLVPFVLAKLVAQVFYIPDTTKKDLRWLYLENDESSESRMTSMRKSSINLMRFLLLSPSEAPYSCNDHHEKVKNFKKPRPQWKLAK